MSWPEPRPGLVIRYSYLWRREAEDGREEGVKDRPCAIVLAARDEAGEIVVYALPITHSPPVVPNQAVELPAPTKLRLGLDGERSWVMVNESNRFIWPGPDLRIAPGAGLESCAYGMLPGPVFEVIRSRFLALAKARRARMVQRTE